MEICLKDTLRTLRQKKNITQEALAQHLGITSQSVGKWERGEGYPDITLLPAIAAYFDVTIDDLLDVGAARKEEKFKAYQAEADSFAHEGRVEEKIAVWERAYAEFPNDCRIMKNLMGAIHSRGIYPTPDADAARIFMLGEKILDTSTDQKIREGAIYTLCQVHSSRGEKEEALKYAEMGGSLHTTRDDLCSDVLEGEEGIKACQEYLMQLIQTAGFTAIEMITKDGVTTEETVAAYQLVIDLLKLLHPDGCLIGHAWTMAMAYSGTASAYAKVQDAEKTLEALEQCVAWSIRDTEYTSNGEPIRYQTPLVNRLTNDPRDSSKNYKGNTCDCFLEHFSWVCYDFLREDARFIALQNRMLEYAEEANHNN